MAPLVVPSGLQLLLADVCGGSESPSMARKVLQWKEQPNRKERYWENLASINNEIVDLWSKLQDVECRPTEHTNLQGLGKGFHLVSTTRIIPQSTKESKGNGRSGTGTY